MDAIDRKILAVLQEDVALGRRDRQPCRAVLDSMLEADPEARGRRRIQRRVAVVDQDKVGLGVTVFVSIETGDHSEEWLKHFAEVVGAMPEVMEFYRMAGDVDYMLRVVVPDIQGWDRLYKKLIAAIPLKNVTSRFAMEKIKSTTACRCRTAGGWRNSAVRADDAVGLARPQEDLIGHGLRSLMPVQTAEPTTGV
jgi:Lrp/AsnC family transcriptional regulator